MVLFGIIGAALVTGALIAGKIIFDSLSEEEERKQQEMENEYNSYCQTREKTYKRTVTQYNSVIQQKQHDYEQELFLERIRQIEELKKHNRPYFEKVSANIEDQRKLKTEDLNNLLDILKQWNETKKNAQKTMLRMKAIRQSILAIEEACYKLRAYLLYLDSYERNMKIMFEKDGSIPRPFSMVLPSYYPYPGKIYYLSKDSFKNYVYSVPEKPDIKLFLSRSDHELLDKYETEIIPFMVCYFWNTTKLSTTLSISKALIKESLNGTQGLYAEVQKTSNNLIELDFYGNKLNLKRSDMLNPSRPLPIGCYRTVFVTEYDFALRSPVIVSEKLQDSISLATFQSIGMFMLPEEYARIKDYLISNNLLDLCDDFKIGPADIKEKTFTTVKLQLGQYYGFLAHFEYTDDDHNNMILRFERLLDNNELLTFSDVFATADVSVENYNVKEYISDELKKECCFLYSYLISEFSSQIKLLKNSPMTLYFDKWLELTKRLAEVLKYSQKINIEVLSWDIYNNATYLYISFDEKLKLFLSRTKNNNINPDYRLHVVDDFGERYKRCNIDYQNEEIIITVKNVYEDQIREMDFHIDLICLNMVYAEQAQIQALSDFKEGAVTNIKIKEAILYMSDLCYDDTHIRIADLYNQSIMNNPKQLEAVNRGFSVKDIFMIQGPPGTGKTTVIKELILQQLHSNPDSRVLVVSQANVAVDNVLRGIKQISLAEKIISTDRLIRCGSDDRIAEDIRELSFSGRIDEYIINLRESPARNEKLRNEWLDFVQHNKEIVGECLIKGYQIIGATCVGFSNRKIGLNGIDFDLVIIDEAGKALPGELLIPINHAKKLIIIGDHKQLPPVVNPELYQSGAVMTEDIIETDEQLDFFNKSFFERLWEDCPETNKCMLDTQFRMPPVISGLVNLFYDGRLSNGLSCYQKTPIAFDSHLVMIDMKGVSAYHEQQEEYSGPYNTMELEAVVLVVQKLRTIYSKRIVIITPYKNQNRKIRKVIKENKLNNVWANTIDAFQGDEEDIIIYCMTRSVKKTNYFSDSARLNVAFSRSKNLLIIVGSTLYLQKYGSGHILSSVYNYIRENGRIIPYYELNNDSFNIENVNTFAPERSIETEDISQTNGTDTERFFDDASPEIPTQCEKCKHCGKELQSFESDLCSSCLNSFVTLVCPKCKNSFEIPAYEKYVLSADKKVIYCQECRIIQTQCSNCHKQIFLPKKQYETLQEINKPILCVDCRRITSVVCDCCGEQFKIPLTLLRTIKSEKKNVYCQKCRENMSVVCDCCGEPFEIPLTLLRTIKSENKNVYCQKCREDVSVVCDCCGKQFEILTARFIDIKNKHMNTYCQDCWKTIKIPCSKCGNTFDIYYWKFRYLLSGKKNCQCNNCRSIP